MSAVSMPAPPVDLTPGRPALLADSGTLIWRGLARWRRDPGALIASLGFNILIVLMFAYLFGGALQVPGGGSYREFLMPGMFVMTMVFGISLTTVAVAEDLERGVTDRLRSMPVSPLAPLAARAVADMLFAAVTLGVLLLTGLAIGWRAHGGGGATMAAVGLILLLRFALIWVGIFLGLVARGQTAVVAVQTLEFPLGFLSNAFVAPSTMPAWLGAVAAWNPLSATVGATRELFGNPGWGGDSWAAQHYPLLAVLWPLVLVAVFLPLSVARYRRLAG
ncbi:Daunorubicin/doxorubicin resistance ABC transpor ter permease protein DrrB [Micromonospora noduli]|uniref:Transport permease protein n=1 Tax=Micromonospora noduli TaxID=709876 RepID=A0A328N7W6_9ACTN|nr:ABC transporter permease [Micromonospora noduli]RAN99239.1 Daunorubicin/doxorubicin resistance ABC transpor ter permease protein DrrB [Micromonospora noduli]RAO36647.1 Daunorubicin/doxorubicin resistance ABC transpor ter permease protein DrrB [Micromonospora noduli]